MASPIQQTIKQESSLPSSSASEQSTGNTTIKQEFNVVMKPEDETFEQFYSEVINL
jgi:hypothetical protein